MCVGNRASNAAYYINKQFESLWEISNECVKKHGYGLKPTRTEVEYGSCLAQLCVGKHRTAKPSKDDLNFFAAFGAPPQLKFICNHEAVLLLHLKSGHYKLEGKWTPTVFDDYTCAFRVQFREHLITDVSYSTFGQTDSCKTKLLILDLNSANFIREFSSFTNGHKLGSEQIDRHQKHIVKHLSTYYLPLLRKAGFHCIYSLPDFDNLSRTHQIDYSVISETDVETYEVFGINIEAINTFMMGRWLEAATCIDSLGGDHDHSSFAQYALAEHRGVYEDIHFHAFFGPPQIHAVCSKEVIFYIDIQDLIFYMDGGFHGEHTHRVSNWKIAFIVDATLVEEEEGSVRRLRLDLLKARFCEGRSICVSETIEKTMLIKIRTAFVQYVTERYLFILHEHHHHHIYHHDVRVIEVEDYDVESGEETLEISTEFRERLCITETFDFDTITTVSQGSLNDHFRFLWKASQSTSNCLTVWALKDYFGASFGPLQIQFPCDSRSKTVIVYVNLLEGFLTKLGPGKKCIGGEKHDFCGWKLAFEVDLRLRDYTKHHYISDSCLSERQVGEYVLKQLILDFTTVKFRQDLSRLSGLFEGHDYSLMRSKCGALFHYITHFYFPQLKQEGHHVLYSIPTWKKASSYHVIKYVPSSFDFQFFPVPCGEGEKVISCLFGNKRNFGNRNMLVMCGTVGTKSGPALPLPRSSWHWSTCDQAFSGMFALSRSVFLDGWLLRDLERINTRTTLVPIFSGISDQGAWDIELVKWYEHPAKHDRRCSWKQIANCKEGLEFRWKYMNEWTYAHQEDAYNNYNGGYTVSCKTTNRLILPTASQNGTCEIGIRGKVELKLSFSGGDRAWSTNATANWSASICLTADSQGTGLKVVSNYTKDIPEFSGFSGNSDMVHASFKDASTLLQEQLSRVVFVEEETIHALESAFTGVWPLFYSGAYGYTLRNPVFNSNGDLLFELVSPIDRNGYITVPGGTRPDICLPTKGNATTRYVEEMTLTRSSTSTLTSTTVSESPLSTPPLEDVSSYNNLMVLVKENDEDDAETVHGVVDETVHQVFETTKSMLGNLRHAVAGEY